MHNIRNEPRFHAFELLASLVSVVDVQGRVQFSNAVFEDAVGLSRRMITGTLLADYFFEPQPLIAALQGVQKNTFSVLRYDAILRRSGQDAMLVHVMVSHTVGTDDVIIEMVPQEQQVRQDREERLAEQARTNKELIRNLAHEIKNPLGGIRGAAQLLDHELERPGLHEYTQVIMQEADRLQSLMDRLLTPHRLPQPAPLNIHEVLERVRSLILAEYPHGITIRRDYDTSVPLLQGDKEQMIQIVLNIARNAAQAMKGNGQLKLRTRIARQVTLARKRHRHALEVQINDTGPGIPENMREKIFYPLVSGREGGTGLGLTLAQSFVTQHGGTITFDSQPGNTTFTLLLPTNNSENGKP